MRKAGPDFSREGPYIRQNQLVCGVDEVGRGAWAGPVVAAAVVLSGPIDAVNDSKKLSLRQREALYVQITQQARYALGWATPREVDQINVGQATFLAMRRAIGHLNLPLAHAFIDGKLMCPDLPCDATTIISGDQHCQSIAAASIIAKVARDRHMAMLGQAFDAYGWARNVGYGVPHHARALAEHGTTTHHRQSFRPVRAAKHKI